MKAYWVVGIALAAGLNADAEECAVIVYANVSPAMPTGMLLRAELKSAAMFREIGVDLLWRSGAVRANSADNACGKAIVVQLENARDAHVAPGALAYATPFAQSGTCIHVFVDRVFAYPNERVETAVLAHVLAHEITHVLERINRHSASGVMKAHWDLADHRRMRSYSLPFAAEDVELIHRGIANRTLQAATD